MTSSKKHLTEGAAMWDASIQKLKDHDVYCESDLVSIVVLACRRPEFTKPCILSTVQALQSYQGEIEWIFIENGNCEENYEFFKSLNLNRKVIVRQDNYGINQGLNQGISLSRGEFVFILENDWYCSANFDFLSKAVSILKENKNVGLVQLRAINDPRENWGFGKPEHSPWSCSREAVNAAGYQIIELRSKDGHEYLIANHPAGYTNNPVVINKLLLRNMGPMPEPVIGSDPRHGESQYQEIYKQTCKWTAHIVNPIYYHAGQKTTNW